MSQHETLLRLRHMLDYAREAITMAAGHTRADLDADRKLNLALVRLLEIVRRSRLQNPRRGAPSLSADSLGPDLWTA
jgi:hypothetical protein